MKRVHIIGRKNSGKTTLVTDLINELKRRGISVGTVKHTHHKHELDTPGKDSHRHRQAGAKAVGILSPNMNAIFWPVNKAGENRDAYQKFDSLMGDCDLILVEGDSTADAIKIEVYRNGCKQGPMCLEDHSIVAIVTDDEIEVRPQVWPRSNLTFIGDSILDLVNHPNEQPE